MSRELEFLTELVCGPAQTSGAVHRHRAGPDLDWVVFEHLASRLRVLTLAVHRLGDHPEIQIPADLQARTDHALRGLRRWGTALEFAQRQFLSQCHGEGISAVALKGPELASRIYGDQGLRASSDMDVLVGAADLGRAGRIATELGYEPASELTDRRGRPLLHLTYVDPRGVMPSLEVHWRIHWYEAAFAGDALSRATTLSDATHLGLEDEFLSLLLFFARDGLQGLRYPADVAAWLCRYREAMDPKVLAHRSTAYPELGNAFYAAVHVLRDRADLDLGPVAVYLGSGGRRARLAVSVGSLAPPDDDSEEKSRAAVVDALVAPTPQVPFVLLRRILAPQAVFEVRIPAPRQLILGAPQAVRRLTRQLRVLIRAGRRPRRRAP